jgi:hypothetical protein
MTHEVRKLLKGYQRPADRKVTIKSNIENHNSLELHSLLVNLENDHKDLDEVGIFTILGGGISFLVMTHPALYANLLDNLYNIGNEPLTQTVVKGAAALVMLASGIELFAAGRERLETQEAIEVVSTVLSSYQKIPAQDTIGDIELS